MSFHSLIYIYLTTLLPFVRMDSGYIECIPGTLNVILSAPHGGGDQPEGIPDRVSGCYDDKAGECIWSHGCGVQSEDECSVTIVRDAYTKELTDLLADNLENLTSKRPHVVINNLHRKKLDTNREIGEAALGETVAEEAFNEYHACIAEAKAAIEADDCVDGTGLFLDIHGHGHPNNWAELGYLISGNDLDTGDFESVDTSIKYLQSRSMLPFETLVRGEQSFGHFLEDEGYMAVPSPTHSGPGEESYFSGGYNTKIHGSRDGGQIDGIQIESSRPNRELPERTDYAAALAQTVVSFMDAHYTVCEGEEGDTDGSSTEEPTDEPGDSDEQSTTETSTKASGASSVLFSKASILVSAINVLFLQILVH